jgi:hypothetical protein
VRSKDYWSQVLSHELKNSVHVFTVHEYDEADKPQRDIMSWLSIRQLPSEHCYQIQEFSMEDREGCNVAVAFAILIRAVMIAFDPKCETMTLRVPPTRYPTNEQR